MRPARGGGRVRHSGLRLRRGRHAGPGPRLHRRALAARPRHRGDLRQQGDALHRRLPALRRGGALGGRRLGRRADDGAAGGIRPRPDPHARQQQVRRGDPARGALRGRPPDPRLLRRDRPLRAPARPTPRTCWSGSRPGISPSTHDYVQTGQIDSKFGFGLADGLAAEAIATVLASRAAQPGRPPHPHRLAGPRAGAVHAGDPRPRRAGRGVVPPRQRRRRPRHRLHRGRRAALDRRLRRGQGRRGPGGLRRRPADPDRARPLAGRQRRRHRLHRRHRQGDPRGADLRRRRRRHVRQPQADALRGPVRGGDRRPRRRRGRCAGDDRRDALRVRRHHRPRGAARLAQRRGHPRDPGDRRLRALAGQQLQRRAAPAGRLLPRRRGPGGGAAGELRGPAGAGRSERWGSRCA